MASAQNKLTHLGWAIQSRAKNQACALRLLALFEKDRDTWKTKKYSRAAQDLIAVSFSLWRAAFLADKTGKRSEVFEHGRIFLERVIEDNSISYPQDKTSREWTFNYYTRNARSSLQELAKFWEISPAYEGKKRNPEERWDYCQSLLDQNVMRFEALLQKREKRLSERATATQVRQDRKSRRRTVRQMTLKDRSKSSSE
jgi:hypothetical protein